MSNPKTMTKTLEDIVEDCSTNKNISSGERKEGIYPFYTCSTTVQTHNSFHYDGTYILFGSRGSIGDTVHLTNGKFAIGTSMIMVKPKEDIDPLWLYQCLRGKEKEIKDLISGGGIPQLTKTDLFTLNLEIPIDIKEQKRIAGILSNVDTNIKLVEEEISNLSKLKTGVLNSIMTNGLNQKELVDSELGLVPLDWDVVPITDFFDIIVSNLDKKDSGDILVPICNYTDVYYNNKITSKLNFMKKYKTDSEKKKFKLFIGDVIVTKDSETPEDIARPALVTEDVNNLVCGYHLAIYRPKENEIYGSFLYHLIQTDFYRKYFLKSSNGATRFGLTLPALEGILIKIPKDHNELSAIVEKLNLIDECVITKKDELNLMKKIRKGLLSTLI